MSAADLAIRTALRFTPELDTGARAAMKGLEEALPASLRDLLPKAPESLHEADWRSTRTLAAAESSGQSTVKSSLSDAGAASRPQVGLLGRDSLRFAAVDSDGILGTLDRSLADLYLQSRKSIVKTFSAEAGQGSGYLISRDGRLVTALHGVSSAGDDLTVQLWNGSSRRASLQHANKRLDLAVMQIRSLNPAENFEFLQHARSVPIVGERTLAIGFSTANSKVPLAAPGIYIDKTAFHESVELLNSAQSPVTKELAQMAPLQGFSGTALLNLKGEVIGGITHEVTDNQTGQRLVAATTSSDILNEISQLRPLKQLSY